MKKKYVIYTALFGSYDDLLDPLESYEECDFICFTDQKNLSSNFWKIKVIDDCNLPPNMMNRKYKILPHLFLNEYEQSLYVDSNILVGHNILELFEKYLKYSDFAVAKHKTRDCLYDEGLACIIASKTNFNETTIQMQHYLKNGFLKNYGLGENNILLRKHMQTNIIKLMEEWWLELLTYTKRDQLSLGYVLWKNHMEFNYIFETSKTRNKYFKYIPHNQFKNRNLFQKVLNRVKLLIKKYKFKKHYYKELNE